MQPNINKQKDKVSFRERRNIERGSSCRHSLIKQIEIKGLLAATGSYIPFHVMPPQVVLRSRSSCVLASILLLNIYQAAKNAYSLAKMLIWNASIWVNRIFKSDIISVHKHRFHRYISILINAGYYENISRHKSHTLGLPTTLPTRSSLRNHMYYHSYHS